MEAIQNLSLVDVEGEVWKDIPNYENIYQVSNLGRVKSLSRTMYKGKRCFNSKEKILKSCLSNSYLGVNLYNFCKLKFYRVHRLIGITFLENLKNYKQVNHIDGNKINNNIENLEWVTARENRCHNVKNINTSSKYIGVYLHKLSKKWQSTIKLNGKTIYLGIFNTQEEAYAERVKFEIKNNIENRYL